MIPLQQYVPLLIAQHCVILLCILILQRSGKAADLIVYTLDQSRTRTTAGIDRGWIDIG